MGYIYKIYNLNKLVNFGILLLTLIDKTLKKNYWQPIIVGNKVASDIYIYISKGII